MARPHYLRPPERERDSRGYILHTPAANRRYVEALRRTFDVRAGQRVAIVRTFDGGKRLVGTIEGRAGATTFVLRTADGRQHVVPYTVILRMERLD